MSIITFTEEQKYKVKSEMMRAELEKKKRHLQNQINVIDRILTNHYEFSLWMRGYKPGKYFRGSR